MLIQAEESPCEIQGSMWNDGQFDRFNPVRRLVIIRRVQEVLIPSHTHTHTIGAVSQKEPLQVVGLHFASQLPLFSDTMGWTPVSFLAGSLRIALFCEVAKNL